MFTQCSSETPSKCICTSYQWRHHWIICISGWFYFLFPSVSFADEHMTLHCRMGTLCLFLHVKPLTDRLCHGISWNGNVHSAGRTCVQHSTWSKHGLSSCASTLFTTFPTSTHAPTCPAAWLPTWAGVPGSAWPARNPSAVGCARSRVRMGDGKQLPRQKQFGPTGVCSQRG